MEQELPSNSPVDRTAIVVIHGIGEQKPYETLDHFARGLLGSLPGSWEIAPELTAFSDDPLRIEKQWTRASLQLTPLDQKAGGTGITLFEYYWAPITEDKITYSDSLLFLVTTALTPLRYLFANVNVIADARQQATESLRIFFKEVARILFLFVPVAAALVLLLAWLLRSSPALASLVMSDKMTLVLIVLAGVRLLYIWMFAAFVLEELSVPQKWKNRWFETGLAIALLAVWFSEPYWLPELLNFCLHLGSEGGWLQVGAGQLLGLLEPQPGQELWVAVLAKFLFLTSRLNHPVLLLVWAGAIALVRWILVHYVGDIAVYVRSDQRTKNFAARSQIIDECSQMVAEILGETSSGEAHGATNPGSVPIPRFQKVLIVGHSLGSVIAHDVVNELLNRCRAGNCPSVADLDRLVGLATFGSPLNKTYYFFREQIGDTQAVLKQVLALLHSFRLVVKPDVPANLKFATSQTPQRWLDAERALERGFRWINIWSITDPISGKLFFYDLQGADNQKHLFYWAPLFAHLYYWDDPRFYDYLISRLPIP